MELRAEPLQSFVRRFVQRFCRAPCTSPLGFVRQRFRKALRLQADAELATLSGPPQRLAKACKIDISHNVGNRVITVGIVNKFHLYAVLMFQTIQMGIWQNFEVPNRMLIRQAVSPIRKAVVADRHNPIAVITLSPTLYCILLLL